MTAAEVRQALRTRWHGQAYATFPELACGTGASDGANTTIDLWVMALWPSDNLRRIAVEIKVSRGDYLREIKRPNKRKRALRYSNQFYFATPKGLLKPEELPPEAGLIEVDDQGTTHEVVPAPYRETFPPTWEFMAAVMRRLDWLTCVDTDEAKRRVMDAMRILQPGVEGKHWTEPAKQLTQPEVREAWWQLKCAFDKEKGV
jgi:hypothetical protein